MIDHARADEGIAVAIEIHAPRIARAVGEDLELFRARMIASDGGGDLHARRGRFGNLHLRMSENAVRHVKPAVRPPGEAVQQFMPIIQAETGQQHRARVGVVIVIRVLQKQEVRRLADINAAVAQSQIRWRDSGRPQTP